MTPEQKLRAAFEEFDELLAEGVTVPDAIATAAKNNNLVPDNFQAFAETHLRDDLETYRARLIRRADNERLRAIATDEIAKCRRHEQPYQKPLVGGLYLGAEEAITECVARRLGRALTDHETRTIEDMWDDQISGDNPDFKTSRKRIREWKRSRNGHNEPDSP